MSVPSSDARKLGIVILLFVAGSVPLAGDDVLVGMSTVDITPPVGYRHGGSYDEEISTGVHDRLSAKAVVFQHGETRAALVMCDLLSVAQPVSDAIRARIATTAQIPFEHSIVAATHNHASPEYWGVLRDIGHARALAENNGHDPHESIDYQAALIEACVDAVEQASQSRQPAGIEIMTTDVHGVAFNRRFHMSDGSVRFNPGVLNPEIERAAGPVDPTLPFLLFRSQVADASPIGSLTTFALHTAVFPGNEFSADFPGQLQRRLATQLGSKFISIFAEGTAGDINHIDVTKNREALPPGVESDRIGNRLADAILQELPRARRLNKPRLEIGRAVGLAPFPTISKSRFDECVQLLGDPPAGTPFLSRVAAWRDTHGYRYTQTCPNGKPLEVQAIAFDTETAIVTLPHEVFVETGITIRAASPFRTTVVISLANDVDFYLPTRRAFEEGSYEVTTCPLAPGCAEIASSTAIRLLNEIKQRFPAIPTD